MLAKNGIEARPVFNPVHRMPPYKNYTIEGQDYSVSNTIANSGVSLPSAVTMNEDDINKVCSVLERFIKQYSSEQAFI